MYFRIKPYRLCLYYAFFFLCFHYVCLFHLKYVCLFLHIFVFLFWLFLLSFKMKSFFPYSIINSYNTAENFKATVNCWRLVGWLFFVCLFGCLNELIRKCRLQKLFFCLHFIAGYNDFLLLELLSSTDTHAWCDLGESVGSREH